MPKLRLKLEVPGAPPVETEVESGAVVGRSRSCHVRLNDEKTSGKHCQIDFRNGAWSVTDLGSSNHTTVNGVELGKGQSHALTNGSRFQAGRAWVEVTIVTGDLGSSATIPEAMSGRDPGTDFGERTIPQGVPVRGSDVDPDATIPSGPPSKTGDMTSAQHLQDRTMQLPAEKTPSPSAPRSASPKPAAPKPAAPKPASPKPASPKPASPKPAAATPAAARPEAEAPAPPRVPTGQVTIDAEPDEFKNVAVGVAIRQSRPRLVVVRTGRVDRIEFSRSPFVVGRDESINAPGRIDHPAISKQHCQFVFRDHRWLLVSYKDNTAVDGVPIPGGEARLLDSECLVQLGSLATLFVVGGPDGAPAESEIYPLALKVLENRKAVTKAQRKQAEADATPEKHVGEQLIENGVLTPEGWADAFKAARTLRDAGVGEGLSPLVWIGIGVGAAILAVVLYQFLI